MNPFCSKGSEFKRWDLANYGELIRRIGDETGATVMILWGPGEEEEARQPRGDGAGPGRARVPHHGIPALALLKRTDLYIGGDTGVMHLAALAGVPVVAIFGPTDHLVNGPLRGRPHDREEELSVQPLPGQGVQEPRMPAVDHGRRRFPGGHVRLSRRREELMRVLFIYPNLNAQIGFNYGIAYMSGLLKAHGIETALLNVNDQLGYPLDLDRIGRDVERIDPDLIGFSVLTNQYKYALEIARHIRTRFDGPIVFGGIHPTMDPDGILAEGVVDYICVGEGEEAFLESCDKGQPQGRAEHGLPGERAQRSSSR